MGIVLILTISLVLSCKKNESSEINCKNLKNGILNNDEPAIRQEMSILAKDLMPHPITGDEWGHLKNFNLLIDRLEQCNDINAVLLGYCGRYTYPPQSEILITIKSNGQKTQKIFDILTSKDTALVYLGMHDTRDKK